MVPSSGDLSLVLAFALSAAVAHHDEFRELRSLPLESRSRHEESVLLEDRHSCERVQRPASESCRSSLCAGHAATEFHCGLADERQDPSLIFVASSHASRARTGRY